MSAVPRFDPQPVENPDDDASEFEDAPSKTQRKQASHDLQKLGVALAALTVERLSTVPMGESLRDALLQHKQTRSHEGRRRQMQFVGKLIRRESDESLQTLQEAIAGSELFVARASLVLHQIEAWRNELLADDDAMTAWLEQHPQADAQRLRSLVRAARKDAALELGKRNGRAYRELFQCLKNFVTDDL
jgi:ribosome-associated protein